MMGNYWPEPSSQIIAGGTATPEAQRDHAIACLKISTDRIASLELELETMRLEHQLSQIQFDREVEALKKARYRVERSILKPFTPWWKRIFKRK